MVSGASVDIGTSVVTSVSVMRGASVATGVDVVTGDSMVMFRTLQDTHKNSFQPSRSCYLQVVVVALEWNLML